MIPLGTSQAIEGVTTTASQVTYTISGLLTSSASPPVATGYQILAQGQLASSAGSLYNPGGSATAVISRIVLSNTASSVQTVTLYYEGTAGANQGETLVIPGNGWAQYEDGLGWQVCNSSGLPAVVAGYGSGASSFIVSNVAVSATTFTNVTSLTLQPGTYLVLGTVLGHLTTATLGHMDVLLSPTTASKTSAYGATTVSLGFTAGGSEEQDAQVIALITVTTPTTVFLEVYSTEATTIEWESIEQSIPNASGLIAIPVQL